jgi:hypothetical protein
LHSFIATGSGEGQSIQNNRAVAAAAFLSKTRVARFFLAQHTKTGKMYQMTIKYTKWPHNTPNGHKMYQQMPLQEPPKFTQIEIFGLKINRLANPQQTSMP